jgi:hypothetical protein
MLRHAITTRARFRASARADSNPRPLFPPVTTATRPAWSGIAAAVQRTARVIAGPHRQPPAMPRSGARPSSSPSRPELRLRYNRRAARAPLCPLRRGQPGHRGALVTRGSTVRTIYLYTFALLGLVLMTIGAVRFVEMGLKAVVFRSADAEQRFYARQPTMPPIRPDMERWSADESLSAQEREALRQWLADYESWRKTSATLDPVAAQRHRDAATGLALLIVGLPLYLFHWRLIRREPPGE